MIHERLGVSETHVQVADASKESKELGKCHGYCLREPSRAAHVSVQQLTLAWALTHSPLPSLRL